MNINLKYAALIVPALLLSGAAGADPLVNIGPPPGAILDFAGQSVPAYGYYEYSVGFTASQAVTNITFAFRDDPQTFILDDVSVADQTHPSSNLVVNGGFESGPNFAPAPDGWTYISFGAPFGGEARDANPHSGSYAYLDSATAGYDGISQAIDTTIGDAYVIDFWFNAETDFYGDHFQQLSNNGYPGATGNGFDLLVYAGPIPETAPTGDVPEPASLMLFAAGLAGIRLRGRRK